MKIALILNRLVAAPTEEEHQTNLIRRAEHNRLIAKTIHSSGHEVIQLEDDQHLKENLLSFKPDLVFLQTFRADPGVYILQIQALLEDMDIPYTGSPPAACRAAQNKHLAKQILRQAGLPTPDSFLVEKGERLIKKPENLDYPLFIKPLFGGCSMGIHPDNPAVDDAQLGRILSETQAHTHQPVLIEEFIDGREFSVGILGNHPPAALPLIEFTELSREDTPLPFRLFDAKTDVRVPEVYRCPAEIDKIKTRHIQQLAENAFRALGCSDYARVDIRCDRSGNPYVLEVNVHPSLLPDSSLPIMAEKAGIAYPQLFEHIFQSALSRYQADA